MKALTIVLLATGAAALLAACEQPQPTPQPCPEPECPPCKCDCPDIPEAEAPTPEPAKEALFTDFGQLSDYPERFKGKRLRLKAVIWGGAERSLKRYVGRRGGAPFKVMDGGVHVDLKVFIPEGMEVPNASWPERAIVEFDCNEGRLKQGNVAVSISRP